MYNDPSREVVVFVFLLSASGNSMAIWRRRIALPPDALQQHGHQLAVTKMDLHPTALQVETYVVGAFSNCPMMITGSTDLHQRPPLHLCQMRRHFLRPNPPS
jgi:hypothetical protein